MIGEISIGGVYLPALLVLGFAALAVTSALIRALSIFGAYRMVAFRPLVDLALFVIVLWTTSTLASRAPWLH